MSSSLSCCSCGFRLAKAGTCPIFMSSADANRFLLGRIAFCFFTLKWSKRVTVLFVFFYLSEKKTLDFDMDWMVWEKGDYRYF